MLTASLVRSDKRSPAIRLGLLSALLFSALFAISASPASAQSEYEQQVQQMYIAYYGRPGDPAGVDYWAGELAVVGGNWIPELVDAFGQSEEYIARFGALDDETLVNNLFLGLFNRSVDDVGLAYYVDLLNGSNLSGYNTELRQSTLAQIALDIANGVQSGTDDAVILANKLSVAAYFTEAISTSAARYGADEIAIAIDLLAVVDDSDQSLTTAQAAVDSFVVAHRLSLVLNDTGITWCANANTSLLECPVESYLGQDGQHGRDVTHSDPTDGHAGFSYTKLNAEGQDLTADAITWSCVRDNVTGLIWEVKTDDGGLHDKGDRYNWYNTDPSSNGGSEGYADDHSAICDGFNRNDPATYCNTQAYVARVNGHGLCGARDWRLPSIDELLSIVSNDRTNPAIDSDYFPNAVSSRFWSSSPYAGYSGHAWFVYFNFGNVNNSYKYSDGSVRLVRAGQ